VIANPPVPTVYTVTATKGICSNTGTISITPLSAPNVMSNIGYTNICAGNSITLFGTGALTYTWTNGVTNNVPFTPVASNGYIVTGTGPNGCTDTAFAQVIVNPLPTFTASSSASVLCKGNAASISMVGSATSYSMNYAPTSNPFVISPTVTTTYTISSMSGAGCTYSATFTQSVSTCNGLTIHQQEDHALQVFPNPNNGNFILRCNGKLQVRVINAIGQTVRSFEINEGDHPITDLPSGIYIVEAGSSRIKIIVNN